MQNVVFEILTFILNGISLCYMTQRENMAIRMYGKINIFVCQYKPIQKMLIHFKAEAVSSSSFSTLVKTGGNCFSFVLPDDILAPLLSSRIQSIFCPIFLTVFGCSVSTVFLAGSIKKWVFIYCGNLMLCFSC